MWYIFKNVDEVTGAITYGIVPEEKVEDKTLMEQLVFKKLETLPSPPEDSDGKEYYLKYDESKAEFYFEV